MIDALYSFGSSLDPVSTVIQFLLWGSAGAGGCWRYTRRSLRFKETEIEKLKNDADFWEKRYRKTENQFIKALNEKDTGAVTTISTLINLSNTKDDDEIYPLLDEWISVNSSLLAKIYARAATALVVTNATENALEGAKCYGQVACSLDPHNLGHQELVVALETYESILSSTVARDTQFCFGNNLTPEIAMVLEKKAIELLQDGEADILAALLLKRLIIGTFANLDVETSRKAQWMNNLCATLCEMRLAEQTYMHCQQYADYIMANGDPQTLINFHHTYASCFLLLGLVSESIQKSEKALEYSILFGLADDAEIRELEGSLTVLREGNDTLKKLQTSEVEP